MKDFLDIIKNIISHYKDSISSREPQNDEFIDMLQNNKKLSKIELNSFYSLMEGNITDEEKKLLEGIVYLTSKRDKQGNMLYLLNESQQAFLSSLVVKVKNKQDLFIDDYRYLQFYKKLYSGLKSNHFTHFFDLETAFKELNISKKDQIMILSEIIENNRKYLEVTEEDVDVLVEYNNSVEVLKNALAKYRISIDDLEENIKNRLLKHVNISDMQTLFDKLNTLVPNYVLTLFNKNQRLFARIAILSTIENLDYIEDFAKKYSLNIYELLDIPSFICPVSSDRILGYGVGTNGSGQGEYGGFEYLKGIVELLESKGIDVREAYNRDVTLFRSNPKTVKENLDLFAFYGIKIDNSTGYSGVLHKSAGTALDRYIEVHEKGYEYIKNNPGQAQKNMDSMFYPLYFAEKQSPNVEIIERRSNTIVIKQKALKGLLKSYGVKTIEDIKEKLNIHDFKIDEEKHSFYDTIIQKQVYSEDMELLNNPYVKRLENKYKISRFIYDINGTRISRLKVIRILSNFKERGIEIGEDEIKYALGYNSILDNNDINHISNCVKQNSLSLGGGQLNG